MSESTLKVSSTSIANIDVGTAWQKLSDLSKAHFYVPDLTGTEITTEQKTGVGTSRYVYSNRAPLIETVTTWEEGKGFTLKLHHDKGDGVPPLFKTGRFHYAIQAEGDNQTRLTNTMEVEMKFGLLGKLLGKLIGKTMQQMQDQITVGQKLFYETGKKAKRDEVIAILKSKK